MWHRGFEPSCRAAPATATLNQFRDFCERAPGGPAHPPMRLSQALLGLHTGRVQTYRVQAFLASRGAGRRILTIRTDSVRKVTCKFLRHSGTVRLDALKTQNLKVSGIMRRGASERRIGRAFDVKFLGRQHGRRGAQIVGQQRKGCRTEDAG